MSKMKSLAKDTAIYGASSIIGKFLNWLLVPLYTIVLKDPGEYGIVTNLYAWTALLLVILTYGMETGFFRFVNKNSDTANKVYSTSLIAVGTTSLLFAILCYIFSQPIANGMDYPQYPEFIWILGIVVAMDAFGSIPFAYLRYKSRPIKFAGLKLLMIFTNIVFNLFFLVVCPWIYAKNPQLIDWFFNPNYGVGYIIVSNFISTTIVTLAMLPEILEASFDVDLPLMKNMLAYSFPLLILGIAGIMNQTIDKIIFTMVYPDQAEGLRQLGIYGACYKVAMVMMMFTQAFRFAYEPFVFAQKKDQESKESYSDAMKYFVIFSFIIFIGMSYYIDILKYIIAPSYWEGLRVVPIVLASFIFQGIFFNLSLWYKLTDKTKYGAYFSILGALITIAINALFIPRFGYMASAWAAFICYFVIMLLSYIYGQKYFPIDYKLKKLGVYSLITGILYIVGEFATTSYSIINYGIKTILLLIFIAYILRTDLPTLRQNIIDRIKK